MRDVVATDLTPRLPMLRKGRDEVWETVTFLPVCLTSTVFSIAVVSNVVDKRMTYLQTPTIRNLSSSPETHARPDSPLLAKRKIKPSTFLGQTFRQKPSPPEALSAGHPALPLALPLNTLSAGRGENRAGFKGGYPACFCPVGGREFRSAAKLLSRRLQPGRGEGKNILFRATLRVTCAGLARRRRLRKRATHLVFSKRS